MTDINKTTILAEANTWLATFPGWSDDAIANLVVKNTGCDLNEALAAVIELRSQS